MRIRMMILGAAAAAGVTIALVPPATATAAPAKAPNPAPGAVVPFACGQGYTDRDPTSPTERNNGIFVRSGTNQGCTPVGEIYNGYVLHYDCYRVGTDPGTGWATWTHFSYVVSGVTHRGWSNDFYLPGNGSNYLC